ncbi:MAG: hypothetical protein NC110_03405 [Ruminococcus sp.]|nr:hypothetical protein [Ruminococcus sp.]
MRIVKKIGIFLCFAVAVVIIFTDSANRLLNIRHVNGTACEGIFDVSYDRFVAPFSDWEYDETYLQGKQFTINDDVFEAPEFLADGQRIEKPVYKYWKNAFRVIGGKTYIMVHDTESTSNIDVSAFGTRIALKVFDQSGNDTGYIIYRMIDADKQAHIFIGQIVENIQNYENRVHILLELEKVQ